MKRLFVLLALCGLVVLPVAALAQAGPPRPAMEKLRADAKASAYAALTPGHASSVQAIVGQVAAGTLDRRAAAGQIDALLSPDEAKAVLGAQAKSRAAMRAAFANAGGPPPPGPGGPPPGAVGPPPGAGPPGGGRFGPPSAGRFLLMVSMGPPQRRDTMPRARSTSAP